MEGHTDFEKQPGIDNRPVENHMSGQHVTIPVIEEQVRIDKKVIETGTVRILKSVHEEEVTVDVPTIHEEHAIERVPVNEYLETPPPPVRYEGDTMIIPVLREEVIVQKRIILVEELRITKKRVENSAPQQITLRKEAVSVNRSTDELQNFNQSV